MNKGEGSELYLLLKSVADGKIQLADYKFNPLPNDYLIVKGAKRRDGEKIFTLRRSDDGNIIALMDERKVYTFTVDQIQTYAKKLFTDIQNNSEIEIKVNRKSKKIYKTALEFMQLVGIEHIIADSTQTDDITLMIHDIQHNLDIDQTFSVKSDAGNISTISNTTSGAKVSFGVIGNITETMVNQVATIEGTTILDGYPRTNATNGKYKKRFAYLEECGCIFAHHPENNHLHNNLLYIDSAYPAAFAEVVLYYYSKSGIRYVAQLNELIIKSNPIGVPEVVKRTFYESKMKDFLLLSALGMKQGSPWGAKESITGGIIVVNPTGGSLCYPLINRNEFKDYLYNYCVIDTPSGTGRHGDIVLTKGGEEYHYTIKGTDCTSCYTISMHFQIRLETKPVPKENR